MSYFRTICAAFIMLSLTTVICACKKNSTVSVVDSSHAKPMEPPQKSETASGMSYDARKVTIHNLPGWSEAFVKQHYPDYKIVAATYDPLCGGAAAIDVAIRSKGKPTYSLIFLPNGSFVQQEQDAPLSSAPQIVIESVKKKYPGFVLAKQIEHLTMADNSIQYEFDLSKGSDKREVVVTSDGMVNCEGKD